MSQSERSHLLLAALCLATGTAVTCPIMPVISFFVIILGLGVLGLYLLVRLWPSRQEEPDDGPEEES